MIENNLMLEIHFKHNLFLQNFGKYSTPPSLECDADKMSDKIRNEVEGFQKDDWEM